jgi:hypothetical protein
MVEMKYLSIKSIVYIALSAVLTAPAAAQQPALPKAAAGKPQQKPPSTVMKGKLEKLSCKLGTEDRHARIAVEVLRHARQDYGKPDCYAWKSAV